MHLVPLSAQGPWAPSPTDNTRMRRTLASILLSLTGLVLSGCLSPPPTDTTVAAVSAPTTSFGIYAQYRDFPLERRASGFCQIPPGGTKGSAMDIVDVKGRLNPPNLWFESEFDFETGSGYTVRFYVAKDYEDGIARPIQKTVLAERHLDEDFATRGKDEVIEVEFEGQKYQATVTPLPDLVCPKPFPRGGAPTKAPLR